MVIALDMDIGDEADTEDVGARERGREFRSGAISFIGCKSNPTASDGEPREEDEELRLGPSSVLIV